MLKLNNLTKAVADRLKVTTDHSFTYQNRVIYQLQILRKLEAAYYTIKNRRLTANYISHVPA